MSKSSEGIASYSSNTESVCHPPGRTVKRNPSLPLTSSYFNVELQRFFRVVSLCLQAFSLSCELLSINIKHKTMEKAIDSKLTDDDSVLDISEQVNRPADIAVQQQRIPGWHPILDPEWMIYSYLVLAVILIPLGELNSLVRLLSAPRSFACLIVYMRFHEIRSRMLFPSPCCLPPSKAIIWKRNPKR